MYSSNQVLQKELDRLGQADYLGGLGVGVATSFVPGVGGLVLTTSGTARLLNEAINTTPGSELWLQNKNKLLAMGMDADTIELFLNNQVFNHRKSTRPPGFNINRVTVIKVTHMQLANCGGFLFSVRNTVYNNTARSANPLTAIAVKLNRIITF